MNEEQIIELLSNSEIFELTNMFSGAFRYLGWYIIKGLAWISNQIESLINEIFSLNSFFKSQQVENLLTEILPIVWVLLAIAIAFLGFKIIFDREFKLTNIVKNIIVAISVVMLLPLGMAHLDKITTTSINGIKTDYTLSANKVISDNLYDLMYLDSVDFKYKDKNKLSEDILSKIDINEVIDGNEVKNKEVLKYKIEPDESGKLKKEKLNKGFFSMNEDTYYRFNFNFWGIFISLACISITLISSSFKVARIIFELGFVKIFGMLYSLTDISSGQKIKEIIRCIVSNFVVLFIISLLLKLYLLFTTWSIDSSSGVLTRAVMLIGASLAVIDGPNIVERILGIDSGVKSGWSVVAGGYSAMRGAYDLSKGAMSVGKSVLDGATNIGAGMAGMASGYVNTNKSLADQMGSTKSSEGNSNLESDMNNSESNGRDSNSSIGLNNDISMNNNSSLESDMSSSESRSINSNGFVGLNDNISMNNNSSLESDMSSSESSSINSNGSVGLNDNISMNNNSSLESDMSSSESSSINSNSSVGLNDNISMNNNSSLESDMSSSESSSINSNSSVGLNDDIPMNNNSNLESDINSSKSSSINSNGSVGLNDNIPMNNNSSLESDMSNNESNSINSNGSVGLNDNISMNNNSSLESSIKSTELNNNNVCDSPPNNLNQERLNNNSYDLASNRTFSQHIKNNMMSNKSIQKVNQNYSIGRNTGVSIANMRNDRKLKKATSK